MKLVEITPPDPPSDVSKAPRPPSFLPGLIIGAAAWGGVYWVVRHFL